MYIVSQQTFQLLLYKFILFFVLVTLSSIAQKVSYANPFIYGAYERSFGGCGGHCEACTEWYEEHKTCNAPYIIIDPLWVQFGYDSQGNKQCAISQYCWHCDPGDFYISIGKCSTDLFAVNYPETPQSCDIEGNPCNPADGSKIQIEPDYQNTLIPFTRFYNSKKLKGSLLSRNWHHNYNIRMDQPSVNIPSESLPVNGVSPPADARSELYQTPEDACVKGWGDIKTDAYRGIIGSATSIYEGGNLCGLYIDNQRVALLTISGAKSKLSPPTHIKSISHPNGSTDYFEQQGQDWVPLYRHDISLNSQNNGWVFTDNNDRQLFFNSEGYLQTITPRGKPMVTLTYTLDEANGGDNRNFTLDRVSGPFGRTLNFRRDLETKQLVTLETPDGNIQYTYDEKNRLSKVTYSDLTSRTYHYEINLLPYHLTGITDQNSERFATWDYDAQGRAILSEHAGQADKIQFTYLENGNTVVTDVLGSARTYHFGLHQGRTKVTEIQGNRCKDCRNSDFKNRTYDTNGILASYTDWNGNQTRFETNERDLRTCRLDAYNTADLRMIKTTWHSLYRIPLTKDYFEPLPDSTTFAPINCEADTSYWYPVKSETFSYDNEGRLTSRNIQTQN